MSSNRICVIPAKARSSRLPGKNLLTVGGVPLVVRAVAVARDAGLFDAVVVSTDDDAIARVCIEAGAEVPFRRADRLARDPAEVDAVVVDVLQWYERERGRAFDWVCTLQPTSPLRTTGDLTASWALLADDASADAVVSVSPFHHHPCWALRIEGGALAAERPTDATRSRSELPALYHPDGCVFWQRCADVLAGQALYAGRVLPFFTPARSAVDIDDPEDLKYAEFLLQG